MGHTSPKRLTIRLGHQIKQASPPPQMNLYLRRGGRQFIGTTAKNQLTIIIQHFLFNFSKVSQANLVIVCFLLQFRHFTRSAEEVLGKRIPLKEQLSYTREYRYSYQSQPRITESIQIIHTFFSIQIIHTVVTIKPRHRLLPTVVWASHLVSVRSSRCGREMGHTSPERPTIRLNHQIKQSYNSYISILVRVSYI